MHIEICLAYQIKSFNSRYVLDITPKRFKYESPVHNYLRFTYSGGIDQIFMIRKYVYFIAKRIPSELLKALYYQDSFILHCSVIKLCLN